MVNLSRFLKSVDLAKAAGKSFDSQIAEVMKQHGLSAALGVGHLAASQQFKEIAGLAGRLDHLNFLQDHPAFQLNKLLQEAASQSTSLLGLQPTSALNRVFSQMRADGRLYGATGVGALGILPHMPPYDRALDAFRNSPIYAGALQAANLASSFQLPGGLTDYRLGVDGLADRLAVAGQLGVLDTGRWQNPAYLSAFSEASAIAHALGSSGGMDPSAFDAYQAFKASDIPGPLGVGEYQGMLNAAGLILPRWPQFRRLTAKEKTQRQKDRMVRYRQSPYIARAKSLVHQYEGYLRDIIHEAMTEIYGPDWADERLQFCGDSGKQILGKWKKRGGNPLDHADFTHYAAIMTQEQHFEDVFNVGFSEREVLRGLIMTAKDLRARSHHPGYDFAAADLKTLRSTWAALKKGLREMDDFLEFQD